MGRKGNAFQSNPTLFARLREEGVEEIVVCGIQSECCVEATCVGALDEGFRVVLLKGSHSTYDAEKKGAGEIETEVEARLKRKGGWVQSWEEFVRGWELVDS